MHEASNLGHYDIVVLLVKSGAEVNCRGCDNDTPLHDAAFGGHLKIVKLLIENGANVLLKNRANRTALDIGSALVHSYLLQAEGIYCSFSVFLFREANPTRKSIPSHPFNFPFEGD